jgi:hypothetical protein
MTGIKVGQKIPALLPVFWIYYSHGTSNPPKNRRI